MGIRLLLLSFSGTLVLHAMTLQDAVLNSTATHPAVLEQVKYYNAVHESVVGSKAGYRPTIDLEMGVGIEKVNNSITAFQNQRSNVRQSRLILNQNIYNGMSTHYALKSEEKRLESAYFSYLEQVNEIAFDTVDAYLELLKQKRLFDLSAQNVQNHRTKFVKVRERTEGGAGTQAELDQIAGRLATAQSEYIAADNAYLDTIYNMQKMMGYFTEADILELPQFDNKELPTSLEIALDKMQTFHPSLTISRKNVNVKSLQYEANKGAMRPKIDLAVTRNWNENLGGFQGKDNSYQAMLTLRYNIYNGHSDNAARQNSLSQIHVEHEKSRALIREQINNLQVSWSEYKLLQKQGSFLKKNAYYMRKVLSSYKKEFALGRRTLLDLLDAEHEVYLADQNVVENRFSYLRSKYRVLFMMGNIYEVIKTEVPQNMQYKDNAQAVNTYDDDYLPLDVEKDHDNVIDSRDICQNSPYNIESVKTGCSEEASEKYLYDPAVKPAKEIKNNQVKDVIELQHEVLKLGEKTTLNYITFAQKSLQFSSKSQKVMREIISQLKVMGGGVIAEIEVFSNDFSGATQNKLLSTQRAYYLKKSLMINGISGDNISVHAGKAFDHSISQGNYNYFTITIYDVYAYGQKSILQTEQDVLVFKPKSLDLNNSEVVHIQTLAKQLKGMGDVTIEVVNHSGDFSSSRKNEKLSRNRALLIKNILVQAGISQENIVAIGLGSYERSFEEILEEDDVSSKNATEFIIKQN
jgi:outer membrane protein, adhesin transport system